MNPRVWFKSISLENVRSFGTKQTINFTDKDGKAARWNVILGDNGTGKTTVLKGLLVIVQNQQSITETGIDFTELWRFDKENIGAEIVGILSKADEDILTGFTSEKWFKDVKYNAGCAFRLTRDYEIDVNIFAYNAARRISTSAITEKKANQISSFYSENNDLINAEEWLVQADYISLKEEKFRRRYLRVMSILRQLFRDEIFGIDIQTYTGIPKVFFKTHYGDVRLHELSLGYKTLIAWMVDFAKGLFDRYPDSENPLAEPAVCLVDEIDLHLHPKFQRTIIQFLTDTFPNTQFIVTAHSPLIVQSAEDANVILLKREGDETHVADSIDVHSWRIDQILSSDLFGGVSARPPATEDKMQRRRALLLKDGRSKKEDQELAQLEEELGQLTSSESWEALKALELIGKALSK
ncbi:AAA family ATPase [Spirosoma sp. KCTC 42546]|uniref:AAA family ATPase n=1 Tax=Spirosoma sp. KCTC 42546 TaxID=2520506 RepID=UPI0011590767|nr:AAA family ATPase [Spirosoma sp. KCTC 42546]QDK78257.1 AAA family ATPase [Spirosoma sp. KCTC 42546]